MPIYISMLRGINLSGHKIIKMEQLRSALEALGLKQVKTYIQSGNVVFSSASKSPVALSKKIEAAILKDFGHSVSVLTRTADEISRIIESNPFLRQPGIDPDKFHVMFLSEAPASAAVDKLKTLTVVPEGVHCLGKEIYFYLPNGVANSLLMKKPIDRILAVVTTTRNWRTVNALHQMCGDCN